MDITALFERFPLLETERCMLRPMTDADAPDFLRLMGNPDVTRYLGRHPLTTLEEARQRIEFGQTQFNEQTGFIWGIVPRGEDRIVGQCLLFHLQKAHFRAELGYALVPEWWGKGVITEVNTRVLDFAFNTMGLHSVMAIIEPSNQASRRVLEKQGFVQEAHFHEDFFDPVLQKFTDTAVLSLLQRNWTGSTITP